MEISTRHRASALAALGLSVLSLTACSERDNGVPEPTITDVRWVVPSPALPPEAKTLPSNNNVALASYDGRLYLAWRSSPTHFASALTEMYIVSSSDEGRSWTFEAKIERGTDVREPHFLVMGDTLHFYFMELGSNPAAFEPHAAYHMAKSGAGPWSSAEKTDLPDEMMVWEIKVHAGLAYMTGYKGNHYSTQDDSSIDVYFKQSSNGVTWQDVNPQKPVVYHGGVSEVGFDFDSAGNLWAVTRNEDGDATGFGSHVAFAPASALGEWQFPEKSNPFRYDSPRMFKHGEDLYLVARRNIVYTGSGDGDFTDSPYDAPGDLDAALGLSARRDARLAAYSALPKRTSLYKIDPAGRSVVWQKDLPSAADTAFASIVEAGEGRYLVANYSNPVEGGPFDWAGDSPDIPSGCETDRWSWIQGQTSLDCGTRIYLATLTFP